MATHGDDLQTAFKEGEKAIAATKIGDGAYEASVVDEDGRLTAGTAIFSDQELLVPVNIYALKPGQIVAARGTTIFNPRRSSKEVEAVFGKHEYSRKKAGETPEHTKAQQIQLENQVREMSGQIAILTAALGIKAQEVIAKQDSKPEETKPEEVADAVVVDSIDDMSWTELQKTAKEKGVNIRKMKRPEVIATLKESV